ncbi:MAG: SUMF1/EgtB/PvdO family nonheme iron enzyme [Planctomycetota bacterium]
MPSGKIGPGTRVGEYVLEEKLGEGGFSVVWKAIHHAWKDRVVAVKIPNEAGLTDELQREAEIQRGLEQLDDRHIVKTLGFDGTHDPPYFVMEFVEGRSLRTLMEEEKHLELPAVLDISSQILKALEHAHQAGVIHLDLKPENILVTPEEVVKLMDFGLGFRPRPEEESMLLSGELEEAREAMGGTLEYMAPEVRMGDAPDPRADLYAFGVILFELLTNERPQPGDLPSDLNGATPKRLDRIFEKCYARVEKRFKSASAILTKISKMRVPERASAAPRAAGPPGPSKEAPLGMIFIPEGSLSMGEDVPGDRGPAHSRFVDAFFMDTRPVTNGHFRRFLLEGGYASEEHWEEGWEKIDKFVDTTGHHGPRGWSKGYPPSGGDRHPVVGVSWFEASAFARWASKRLPTEEEWERAARGNTIHPFPWGKNFDKNLCNTKESAVGGTTPAGRYTGGASPFGVLDMTGNVLEWTASYYGAYPGNEEENPYFGEFYRVLRGGAWYFKSDAARVTVRHYLRPDLRLDYAGFRCVRDA